MAGLLVFLCSPAASGVNDISMLVDYSLVNSGIAGSFTEPPMG